MTSIAWHITRINCSEVCSMLWFAISGYLEKPQDFLNVFQETSSSPNGSIKFNMKPVPLLITINIIMPLYGYCRMQWHLIIMVMDFKEMFPVCQVKNRICVINTVCWIISMYTITVYFQTPGKSKSISATSSFLLSGRDEFNCP